VRTPRGPLIIPEIARRRQGFRFTRLSGTRDRRQIQSKDSQDFLMVFSPDGVKSANTVRTEHLEQRGGRRR
jgi:hypothetical protein